MDYTIKKILKSNQVDGIFHTHVSLCCPKGKFQFNRQTLEEFWDSYCTIIKSNPEYITGIAEKSQQYLPVLADIDLKIRDNGEQMDDSLYTEDQLKSVVEIYQSTLRQIVDNLSDNDLTCIALEKKMYQQSKNDNVYFKHGFHLHFPHIFLNKVDQETQLIPRVQQAIGDLKLFKKITDDSASAIDKVCCKVPWLLYGSRKSEEHQPYRITKIYDSELNIISIEKAFKNYQIFDQKEQIIQIRGKIEHYLPRILSVIPYGRSTKEIKRGIISPIKEKLKKEQGNVSTSINKLGVEESLTVARRLLPMISSFRADDRNEWMNIGWILYNISEANPDGLELWCEFSSRCEEKYDENICIYQWERMTKRDIGIGTLRHYASVDNPVEYKKYKEEQTNKYVLESLDGSHNDVAKALFADYNDEFVCASVSNRIWFQFSNHRWEQIEEGVFLREKISGRIVIRYIEMAKKLYDDMKGGQDKAREAMTQSRIKAVNKMISSLKSAPYKSNVMKEAIEVFYDPKFREKLDADPYLIAFKNGVYDLRMNYFRPGRPEDYLSKNMPINYVDFSEDDEKVHDVSTFLEQVFPDKSVRNYFLDVSSDIFVGGNHEKIVLFWTGEGDNGKSVTQLFFEIMMGKLAIKLNTNIITGKKPSAGAAFADLARAGGGVRWAVLEEPDADEMINTGIFKHMSGNDTFYARDLFERGKDGREIKPLFKLVFICLAEGTKVCLPQGISLSIEKLKENTSVLAWKEECDGLITAKQNVLLDKGKQKCITLTLLDGRKITCTPDHKFLSASNEWIEAKNINRNETVLKMGIDTPNCDDICNTYDYKLKAGNYLFDLTCQSDRLKAAAFSRLLGYIGSCNKSVYIGHKLDGEIILSDIMLLTGKNPKLFKNRKVWQTNVPSELTHAFSDISPIQKGGRLYNKAHMPSFIYEENCPLFLIREFIAGLFGGDGILPSLVKNNITSIQLVASKIGEHVPSLINEFEKISDLLLKRFNIESIVRRPPPYEENKYNVFITISKNNSILRFAETIGFRYCHHKIYRITAISSFLRYKNSIISQNQSILERTRELLTKYKQQNVRPLIVQMTKEGEILKTYKSTQEAQHSTGISHGQILSACQRYEKSRKGSSGGFFWKFQKQESKQLDEPGCTTVKEAFEKAKKELETQIVDEKYLVTLNCKGHYITYEKEYKMPSFIDTKEYMTRTNLIQFCNQDKGKGNIHYSVDKESVSLPCYNMPVIRVEDGGMRQVYDINVEEPCSNFVANGIVTHNCNKLPRMKAADKAVWNRVRVIPFEATFCRPDNPAPESYEEQLREKRFPMDKQFGKKIPNLVEAFAWYLLQHRLKIMNSPRIEPEKVRSATEIYRKQNDIYRQFVDESIAEANDKWISLIELYNLFKEWFKDSLPGHSLPVKNEIEEYFSKIWGFPDSGKKWKGYRQRTIQDDIDSGEAIVLTEEDLVTYEK